MKPIDQEELLTVREFAEKAGVSVQAVYKRLNNSLNPYIQLVKGRKMLKSSALSDIYGVNVEQPFNHSIKPELKNKNNSFDEDFCSTETTETILIAMLQKELESKNHQLLVKDKQIEELNKRLEESTTALMTAQQTAQAAQALHAGTMSHFTTIGSTENNDVEQKKQDFEKPSWFSFLFKKK